MTIQKMIDIYQESGIGIQKKNDEYIFIYESTNSKPMEKSCYEKYFLENDCLKKNC